MSKPRGPPPTVNRSTRPLGQGTFAQVASKGAQPSSIEGIVRLAKAFPELPTQRLAAMQRQSAPSGKRPKRATPTVHGPSRRQVLLTVEPASLVSTTGPDAVLSGMRTKLSEHHSRLEVQSMSQAYGGFAVVTDRVASEDEVRFIREGALLALPGAAKITAALPSSTSYLKLVDVPLKPGGGLPTVEEIMANISRAGLKDLVVLHGPPRAVRDSRASDTATVYLNVADSVSGARAKLLLRRAVQFGLYACPFRAARANPGLALCQRCWKWGHPETACRAPQTKCPSCGGPHCKEHHRALAGCCKGNKKATPPIPPTAEGEPCPHAPRCPNCGNEHAADDRRCNFWRHRFDQDWIRARYSEVSANRCSRSPPSNPFPAGSGGRP